jgi:hypothetical protein
VETNRKTHTNISHLWYGLVLLLVLSVALPTNAQTTPTEQPRSIPAPGAPTQTPPPPPPDNNGITQQELANMNNFLGEHPEIAEQLRKDPSLVDNQHFVADHPALQQFLQSHGDIKAAFRDHPDAFMQAEERYDQRADRIRPQALANMDRFLDDHREIAEQLRKNPSLIDNQRFVADHPALQEFLQTHPDVRDEFRENPNAFMQAEDRYDRREDARNDHDRDWDRREMGSFGEFLRGHSTCADALHQDPSLANNREFLENNPDLRGYLQAHPAVQQQLAANPQAVMTSPALAGVGTTMPHKGVTTTPKPEDSMKPQQ